jgi:uncharacterized membrane protein
MADGVTIDHGAPAADPGLVRYTHIIYGLHALAAAIGLLGAGTVVGEFILGVPSIVAVIMNYARRSDARGGVLESHFTWQIRTFWYALLWLVLIWVASVPLMVVLIGFVTLHVGVRLLALWIIYRVVRGWLALRDGRPMPVRPD